MMKRVAKLSKDEWDDLRSTASGDDARNQSAPTSPIPRGHAPKALNPKKQC